MKIFFYIKRNQNNKSGISSKIWKIERNGRTVTRYWGACIFDPDKRKPAPNAALNSRKRTFRTEEKAKTFEEERIAEKLRKGYERNPKRKP